MIHHLTYGMLDRKFPKTNTIAMSQHYMIRLLENPDTSPSDRRIAIAYIRDHPAIFTALPDDTPDPVQNEAARKLNGNGVHRSFIDYVENSYRGCVS